MKLHVNNLHKILDEAEPLPGMGIKIKEICRDGNQAIYVAEIPAKAPGKGYVTPHYHPDIDGGTEWYQIIEAGKDAVMCFGQPQIKNDKTADVIWEKSAPIKTNDFFIVPNGVVHSLVAGKKRLRFVFGCPDAHLDNNIDKVVIDSALPPAY